MATITKTDLIERLCELSDPTQTRQYVEQAITALGWQGRDVFNGTEVITLGTKMGEFVQADLLASSDPAERAQGAAMAPYMDSMRQDVLPHLDPQR